MSKNNYQYTTQDNIYYIKLSGELRYQICSGFEEFIENLFDKEDFENIIVDISDVEYIDSTNIGLLAKIAKFVKKTFSHKLNIIGQNEDIKNLLTEMGFGSICNFKNEDLELNELRTIPLSKDTKENMGDTLLDAHETLMEVDDSNKERFRNVVDLLKEDNDKEN